MITVGMFEAKAKLSELVAKGEIVTITNHRKPVARIYPIIDETPEFLAELARQCQAANEAERIEDIEAMQDWSN